MNKCICFIFALLFSSYSFASVNPWLSLVLENERGQSVQPLSHQAQLDERAPQLKSGGFVMALDGQAMRMPGFVVALEGDSEKITEFLLVPYFGACLHMPPPPPNQIIHVSYPKGISHVDPWQVVWISGEMQVKANEVEGILAGYAMDLDRDVELYVP